VGQLLLWTRGSGAVVVVGLSEVVGGSLRSGGGWLSSLGAGCGCRALGAVMGE
jgi:hypothetical protein